MTGVKIMPNSSQYSYSHTFTMAIYVLYAGTYGLSVHVILISYRNNLDNGLNVWLTTYKETDSSQQVIKY